MAEQDIQHSTNNTPTQSDIHVETWKGKQRRHICTLVHTRTHTHTQVWVSMIDTDKNFSGEPLIKHPTDKHIHAFTDTWTGQQDNLCIKGDFKEIKDLVTTKKSEKKMFKVHRKTATPLLLLPSVCVIDRLSRFHRDESAFSSSHLFSLQGN